jgi:formyl-CoA transferase
VTASSASWSDVAAALARLGREGPDDPLRAREEIAKLVAFLPGEGAARVLRGAGLPASTVNSVADLIREPHLWSRGNLVRLSHPDLGEIVTQGVVPVLSRTPGRVTGWSRSPGSDNEAVLGELLGYTPNQTREATEPRRECG